MAERRTHFLTTERLGFGLWTPGDMDLATDLWGDPLVTRYIDARGTLTRDMVQERLDRELGYHRNFGIQYWPVFNLETNEHIGCCGLKPHSDNDKVRELGFHLKPRHWGKGYATEAGLAVIKWGFEEKNLHGMVAGHHPDNQMSQGVLQKLGFTYIYHVHFAPTGLQHPLYRLERPGRATS